VPGLLHHVLCCISIPFATTQGKTAAEAAKGSEAAEASSSSSSDSDSDCSDDEKTKKKKRSNKGYSEQYVSKLQKQVEKQKEVFGLLVTRNAKSRGFAQTLRF
jgi:hypothetical protein